MDNTARPETNGSFGADFMVSIEEQGSLQTLRPLEAFLAECRDPSTLRQPGKLARAALLADIAHFMCVSHGRHPGVVDHAATKMVEDSARGWLVSAIDAFASERAYLNRLTVAAGPMHSHSGQHTISQMLANQAKSFQMLATSDRAGCAAGAAIAIVMDWQMARPLLDGVAMLLSINPPECNLPGKGESIALADSLATSPLIERAMNFGASQLLAQQRGLWQIVAARHAEIREID